MVEYSTHQFNAPPEMFIDRGAGAKIFPHYAQNICPSPPPHCRKVRRSEVGSGDVTYKM